jgi:hypothetical protein
MHNVKLMRPYMRSLNVSYAPLSDITGRLYFAHKISFPPSAGDKELCPLGEDLEEAPDANTA